MTLFEKFLKKEHGKLVRYQGIAEELYVKRLIVYTEIWK